MAGPMTQPPAEAEAAEPSPEMAPEEAMQMLQDLGIEPDMLPMLAKAIEALEAAGMIEGQEPHPASPDAKLNSVVGDAMAKRGM